jgi:hypothetical protein
MLIIANNQLDSSCSEINIKYDEVNVQTYANASNIIGFGYRSTYSLCFYWVGTWERWQEVSITSAPVAGSDRRAPMGNLGS